MAVINAPYAPNTARCDIFGMPIAVGGLGRGSCHSLRSSWTELGISGKKNRID